MFIFRNNACLHISSQNRPNCFSWNRLAQIVRVNIRYKDRLGVGTLAHLPGVRGDALLRQFAQPASQQVRARDEASGHRVGRTGRTLAVLLSRRRLRGILMARRYGATATVLWVAASTASVVTTCPNSSCSVAITAR